MRSRTELVTTTFIDSDEDEDQISDESDDSEEDWKPENRGNNKKRPSTKIPLKKRHGKRRKLKSGKNKGKGKGKGKGRGKGSSSSKSSSTSKKLIGKRRKLMLEHYYYAKNAHNNCASKQKFFTQPNNNNNTQVEFEEKKPENCGVSSENLPFTLLLHIKDLNVDYKTNSRLSLWRLDESINLLQKYIRVKTDNYDEFIFTSSSVYFSCDETGFKDFVPVVVKYLQNNCRRIVLQNPNHLKFLLEEQQVLDKMKTENLIKDENCSDSDQDEANSENDDHRGLNYEEDNSSQLLEDSSMVPSSPSSSGYKETKHEKTSTGSNWYEGFVSSVENDSNEEIETTDDESDDDDDDDDDDNYDEDYSCN